MGTTPTRWSQRPKISMSYKDGVHYDLFAQKFIIHPYLNILDIAS